MKRITPWMMLAALGAGGLIWSLQDDRAGGAPDAAVRGDATSATRATPTRVSSRVVAEPGAPRRFEPPAEIELEAIDVDAMSAAELDLALTELVGDAESYWELSDDARAHYDRLQEARLARLGLSPDPADRLAPHRERLTIDGVELEVTP